MGLLRWEDAEAAISEYEKQGGDAALAGRVRQTWERARLPRQVRKPPTPAIDGTLAPVIDQNKEPPRCTASDVPARETSHLAQRRCPFSGSAGGGGKCALSGSAETSPMIGSESEAVGKEPLRSTVSEALAMETVNPDLIHCCPFSGSAGGSGKCPFSGRACVSPKTGSEEFAATKGIHSERRCGLLSGDRVWYTKCPGRKNTKLSRPLLNFGWSHVSLILCWIGASAATYCFAF